MAGDLIIVNLDGAEGIVFVKCNMSYFLAVELSFNQRFLEIKWNQLNQNYQRIN